MKKIYLLLLFLLAMLVACQNEETDQNDVQSEDTEETTTDSEELESDSETAEEEEGQEEAEILEPSNTSDTNEETIEIVNLLDSPKEIQHPDLDVTITLEEAFFTMKATPTGDNPKDSREIIATDKEIYFQVIASILNDTKDSFSFGNSLGDAKVYLVYDNEHEFDLTASAETNDGNEFGASSAEPLTTTTAHYFRNIPIAAYETDKALALKIVVGEEEYNIELR
ncbi:hypothetical protein [Gracilibacillus massiliensis]|uniref:hypothetical protein n=1 Tax=Gracilibacillus massiliensis TaxID=1564956 RepID=UPI00071C6C90|nr:hypothetical protein [Gracilibacillus massiliensis]